MPVALTPHVVLVRVLPSGDLVEMPALQRWREHRGWPAIGHDHTQVAITLTMGVLEDGSVWAHGTLTTRPALHDVLVRTFHVTGRRWSAVTGALPDTLRRHTTSSIAAHIAPGLQALIDQWQREHVVAAAATGHSHVSTHSRSAFHA